MLCSLMLTGLVKGLKSVEWGINKDYRMATVSLDPTEPLDTTARTANRYLTQYGRPDARPGWRFFTGSENNIRAYADAIGFSYRYDENRKEYAHPAAIAIAAPDGTITRYLYGIEFDPKTLRLALVGSSQGKIGTTLDKIVLYCFHYDATEGRYAPVAQRIMKIGGAVMVVALSLFLAALHLADRKRRRHLAESTAT
jgi:protein SCO1/2